MVSLAHLYEEDTFNTHDVFAQICQTLGASTRVIRQDWEDDAETRGQGGSNGVHSDLLPGAVSSGAITPSESSALVMELSLHTVHALWCQSGEM
jgi:hypothetical protein